ncbi:MAG: hypothetical protein ACYSTT_25635 [Planctomycetota bacterium]|jgi:hypothetical protein
MNGLMNNEKNACDAFREILQKIKGVEYEIVERPEERNRKTPDVDFILAPNLESEQYPKIAVEHTIIEAHEKQFKYINQLYGIEKELDLNCRGKLPNDFCFNLIAPPSLIAGMNKKNRDKFVGEISSWIPNVAKSLTTDQQSSRLYNKYEVSLWCVGSCSGINGTIRMMPSRPGDSEKERRERLHRAIEEKLPKLIKYKDKGVATALLLEDVSAVYINPREDWIPRQYYSEKKCFWAVYGRMNLNYIQKFQKIEYSLFSNENPSSSNF